MLVIMCITSSIAPLDDYVSSTIVTITNSSSISSMKQRRSLASAFVSSERWRHETLHALAHECSHAEGTYTHRNHRYRPTLSRSLQIISHQNRLPPPHSAKIH